MTALLYCGCDLRAKFAAFARRIFRNGGNMDISTIMHKIGRMSEEQLFLAAARASSVDVIKAVMEE